MPELNEVKEGIYISGVGTIAAVVVLAATLLGRKLIFITCYKLASFSGSEAKVKQPLRCISLICSYMRTFPIKVHYKVIKILLMQIFKETTTSDES